MSNKNEEPKIEEGDIVMLKSGGPKMTVTGEAEGDFLDKVECQWFDGGKSHCSTFSPKSLIKVELDTE